MEIYCLIRSAEFDEDDDYIDVECYSDLEKCKSVLKEYYENDTACQEGESIVSSNLADDSYYVEVVNENIQVGGCRITCEITKTSLQWKIA